MKFYLNSLEIIIYEVFGVSINIDFYDFVSFRKDIFFLVYVNRIFLVVPSQLGNFFGNQKVLSSKKESRPIFVKLIGKEKISTEGDICESECINDIYKNTYIAADYPLKRDYNLAIRKLFCSKYREKDKKEEE